MGEYMIVADQLSKYEVKEAFVIVLAMALIIAMGGLAIAAVIVCGWGRVQAVNVDVFHLRANIVCR